MSCRVCKNVSGGSWVTAFGARQARGHLFSYFFCNDCGSLSIQEIPHNLHEFYHDYYSLQNLDTRPSREKWIRQIVAKSLFCRLPDCVRSSLVQMFLNRENDFKLTSLAPLRPQKYWNILDVGSGSGDFVYSLHDLGFHRAIGIDPFLSETLLYENGAIILQQDITQVEGKYDLITFHHSFEHVTDPILHLERVKQLLKPTGTCVIRLPSIDSWSYKIFKGHWVGIHAPYHLILPSRVGMDLLLKPHGLKVSAVKGEQLVDFFLMSKENFMNISDLQKDSIRSLMAEQGDINASPWHCKKELAYWKSMKKHVQRHHLCDCIAYYVTHA